MSDCRSCDAPIFWVKMAATGKKMPLDPHPRADGNIVLLATSDPDGTPLAEYSSGQAPISWSGERYASHFATCPHAAAHRTAS